MVIDKPWGHERILEKNDNYVVKEICIKAGKKLSLQYHKEKVEIMALTAGNAALYKEPPGIMWQMRPFEPFLIAPGVLHRLGASPDEDCIIVEISTTELDDVVRIDDDYGRAECPAQS